MSHSRQWQTSVQKYCVVAKGSNDFRDEWNVQFGLHSQVSDDVVVPEDTNIPMSSFDLCKEIMKRTQLAVRKNIDKTLIRRKDMAKRKSDSQEKNTQGRPDNDNNQERGSGECRACRSKDH